MPCPLFQISHPLFQKFCSNSVENFPNFKFLDFHPPKFPMTFLVIDHKFGISPIPISENFYSPTFPNVHPCLDASDPISGCGRDCSSGKPVGLGLLYKTQWETS